MIYRYFAHWLIFCLTILSVGVSPAHAENVLGFSETKPSTGRCVKTDRGYMVPYRTTIPDTEVSFEMVPVPGGTLRMRCQKGPLEPDGVPEVEVKIEPFWIGRYEVTWEEYNQYCDLLEPFSRFENLGIRRVTSENQSDAVTAPSIIYDPSMYFPATPDKGEWPKHTAAAMTQYGAKQYTKWLSKHLLPKRS